ncbi:3' exoribonuclease family protein [Cladophialophora carrionii]|uniref:3' exoribonuclease family protein n=1 Tax=Cladophialophora carrionii TaxID=86049 RepID=A0A1C1C8G1_9EURO|nr:3' exoribonuclease family protein [Cladophialophora carrionii]
MSDRRRINGPPGTTQPPRFAHSPGSARAWPERARKPNELRKIFLQTGLVPSASGSAYLELESSPEPKPTILRTSSTIKLSCAVHGPKPLPRTASFSPNLQLSASIKFAPFATRIRQGYVPDSTEKDLGLHLENALKGVLLPDRWPKSAIDIAVTVLEGEDDREEGSRFTGIGLFNLLAAAINVSMAALADARIDCLDLLAAGVGAVVPGKDGKLVRILDPAAVEHGEILSTCVVGYLPSRDEVVEMWSYGSAPKQSDGGVIGYDELADSAIAAARGAQTVIQAVLLESVMRSQPASKQPATRGEMNDIEMNT